MTGKITIAAKEIEKDGKTGTQFMVLGHTRGSVVDRIRMVAALLRVMKLTPMEVAAAAAIAADKTVSSTGYDIKIPVNEGSTKEEAEP